MQGYAYSKVTCFLSAIRFNHKLQGLSEPDPTSNFIIKKMLEGYRRSKPSQDTRLPVAFDILRRVCAGLESVCRSTFEHSLFLAAYTLAFFGLFRVGELVFTSDAMAIAPLLASDILDIAGNRSFSVRLRRSKTNQRGPPVLIPILAVGTEACPVNAMLIYLQRRPCISSSGYLFVHADGTPLTRYQFGAVLSKALRAAGIDAAGFKSHSFRIGAATWLAQKGVPFKVIQRMGRWSSDAFMRYIRL